MRLVYAQAGLERRGQKGNMEGTNRGRRGFRSIHKPLRIMQIKAMKKYAPESISYENLLGLIPEFKRHNLPFI